MDSLATAPHRVIVPTVVNARLEGMLARRGFVHRRVEVDGYDEAVDAWVREP